MNEEARFVRLLLKIIPAPGQTLFAREVVEKHATKAYKDYMKIFVTNMQNMQNMQVG